MNVVFHPMSMEESWGFIERKYYSFHSHLKHYGYDFRKFIPNSAAIIEMFEKQSLSSEELNNYKEIFEHQIYNKTELHKLDVVIQSAILEMISSVDKLKFFITNNNLQMPRNIKVLTTYGNGGSYDCKEHKIIFRMTEFKKEKTLGLLQHEFVHLLIEKPIIQKYSVPQDLKERIVDIICLKYFNKPVQKSFEISFANKYITEESVEKDLHSSVKQMMKKYYDISLT